MKHNETRADRSLIAAAKAVRLHAHAPYSGFRVGAAIRSRSGDLFTGCNVENASLGAGICAERGAILHAVASGLRPGDLEVVAIYTSATQPTPPCGVCLQVLVEFGPEARVLLAGPRRVRATSLPELYPFPFRSFPRRARR